MGLKRMDLIHSIADTIKDYREGEIDPINASHVGRWIRQFDYLDQLTILTEMDSILKRFYFSRAQVEMRLRALLLHSVIAGRPPAEALAHTRFLDIQKKGESQKALLEIIDSILRSQYGLSLADCGKGSPATYVYLDDAIYTGNRLRYDLAGGDSTETDSDIVAWIPRSAPSGCKLVILVLAEHASGFLYASEHIDRAAQAKKLLL